MSCTTIKFDGIINGTVALTGKDRLEPEKFRCMEQRVGNDIAFIKRTNIDGIFTFGIEQTAEYEFGHRAGYIWSSRATVMNKVFDVALVEILYKSENSSCYSACSIDVAHLQNILEGTDYYVVLEPRVSSEDVYYDVKRRNMNER